MTNASAQPQLGVIFNPNSRKNVAQPQRYERLQTLVQGAGSVVRTPDVDALQGAITALLSDAPDYWVADGGDGALHWMINTLAELEGIDATARDRVFVPTRGGTVDFVAKAIGLRGSPEEIVRDSVGALTHGEALHEVSVPSLVFEGEQRTPEGETRPFRRIGFGNALAGYGANFFIPFYAGRAGRGALRIIGVCSAMFGVAITRSLWRGPLDRFKPQGLRDAEETYLRPLRGEVKVDGEWVRDAEGEIVREHTALHCASLPLDLNKVLYVFPQAGGGKMHVHAGHVSAAEMARIWPTLARGGSVDALLPRAFDGCAQTLDVQCDPGRTMDPVLDGELYHGVTRLAVRMGPRFRMAGPRARFPQS